MFFLGLLSGLILGVPLGASVMYVLISQKVIKDITQQDAAK